MSKLKTGIIAVAIVVIVALVLGCCDSTSSSSGTQTSPYSASTGATITPTPTTSSTSALGMSKSNPAPIGTAITFSQKGSVPYTATLTIEQVVRGDEALQMLQKANMFNGKLEDQSLEYLLIKAKFTLTKFPGYDFNGKHVDTLGVSDTDFHVVSDKKYTGMVFAVAPSPEFGDSLFEGGESEGWVALPVYKDDPHPYIEYGDTSSFSSEPTVWFQV